MFKKYFDMWLVICERGHMTGDTWQMTVDRWNITRDTWCGMTILSNFQLQDPPHCREVMWHKLICHRLLCQTVICHKNMSQGNMTQVNRSQSEIMIKHVIMTLETNKIIFFFLLVLEQLSFKKYTQNVYYWNLFTLGHPTLWHSTLGHLMEVYVYMKQI